MSYLILSAIVILISFFYEQVKKEYKISKGMKFFFYLVICFTLCLFAGLRTEYNDTITYIWGFERTPKKFSSLFSGEFTISKVYLFQTWNYVVYHFISKNVNVYFFLSAIIFVCPAVHLMDKYTKNFTFSMFLFMFGGMYLFSLAGLKQAMSTGVIMMGLPALFRKEYFKYYIYAVLAIGFHTYAIFLLIVPLLGSETFNIKTILFCLATIVLGALLSYFSGTITVIIKWLGKDVEAETLQTGSVNALRAVTFAVPFVLTALGRKNLAKATIEEKWFVKIGILSAVFMALALFGNPVLFGRIPQYFIVGVVVAMPLLVDGAFAKKDRHIVYFIAVMCYLVYGLYGLYVDGAFTEDIFKLIWF